MFPRQGGGARGWGMYYDRGELFTYLSPGFASGVIAGGPFGVNQTPPWVSSTACSPFAYDTGCGTFANPWGPTLGAAPSGNPADLQLPNANAIAGGIPLFSFADYNRANKLPYTLNQTTQYSMAAAQRFGHRNWLCGEFRAP